MPKDSSLLSGVPRWAACRPHSATALLRWANAWRRSPARMLLMLLLVLAAACGLAEIPQTGPVLGWLGSNAVVTFVLAVCLVSLSTTRRRERAAAEAASSWLTPLPVATPVFRHVLLGTGARLLLLTAFAALCCLLGRPDATATRRLALALFVGTVCGSLAGWRLPRAADDGATAFHYATVRRVRGRWATDPSLLPLSYWPTAQGRIFSRPKVLSRVAFMTLIGLPLGTPGQVALAAAAACIALFSMASLSLAAVRVAFDAAHWLAPTTLRRGRFTAAMVWRVTLTQAAATAVIVFFACFIDLPRALRLGVPLGIGFLMVSLAVSAVACRWACGRLVALRAMPGEGLEAALAAACTES